MGRMELVLSCNWGDDPPSLWVTPAEGTHQLHLWWWQTWQLWHIPLFIPHTKHSHSHHHLCRNTNQHLPKHAPVSLPAHSCTHNCSLCISGACSTGWCQSQKPVLTPMQSLEIPHTQRNLLPRPASPASSSIRAGEGTGSSPHRDSSVSNGFGEELGLCAKAHPTAQLAAAHHWQSWDSHGAWLTAQNTQEIVLTAGTKYTCSPLTHQEGPGLGKARGGDPQHPSSAICHIEPDFLPTPKVLLLQFQKIIFAKLSCYPEKDTQNISDTSFNFIRKCPFDFSGTGTFKNYEFQRHDNNQIVKNKQHPDF